MKQGATLSIPTSSKEQRDKLFEAEKLLREAGISFDTGYDVKNHVRDWELDWSLKGANIKTREYKEE